MLTPQEVASHVFSKATLGGYNMSMVDEFLDVLTEDYTALYNDNAILKNKLKVLSDTVEEYRATDAAMRKTLLAAQQMAESIVGEAEKKKATMVQDAEAQAQSKVDELRRQYADEQARLQRAREATASYIRQVQDAQRGIQGYLDRLEQSGAQEPQGEADEQAAQSPLQITLPEAPPEPEHAAQPEPVGAVGVSLDEHGALDSTRRFEDLQPGRDYEIT